MVYLGLPGDTYLLRGQMISLATSHWSAGVSQPDRNLRNRKHNALDLEMRALHSHGRRSSLQDPPVGNREL